MAKPRIQISISQEMKDILKELSSLTGSPSSKLASQTLESALPVFKDMVEAMRVAKESESRAAQMMQVSAFKHVGSSMSDLGSLMAGDDEYSEGKK